MRERAEAAALRACEPESEVPDDEWLEEESLL